MLGSVSEGMELLVVFLALILALGVIFWLQRFMARRHLVVIVLLWMILIGSFGYWFNETHRRQAAAAVRLAGDTDKGAEVFAANCMTCHGPTGQGVVGLPLNVEANRGNPSEQEDTREFLEKTIKRGRSGQTGTVWDTDNSGKIISLSQMPPWSKDEGGGLTEDEIAAVVNFIMVGDWENTYMMFPEPALQGPWPEVKGLPAATITKTQDLIMEKGCLSCHKIGNKGGEIGPDLSKVGNWMTRDRLQEWLQNPQAMAPDKRGPSTWSMGAKRKLGQAWMPRIPLTEDQLELLLDYLGALK